MKIQSKILAAIMLSGFTVGTAVAQDLTFKFNNPSFGGNSFNSAHLLALAELQQEHHDPVAGRNTTQGNSASAAFIRQLESRLLSNLASNLVTDITGAEIGPAQTVTVGDQSITYERTAEELIVTISSLLDPSASTTIVLPAGLAPIQ